MDRKDLEKELIDSNYNNYLLLLPTGYGKTKLTIEKINQWYQKDNNIKIIIFTPRLTLFDSWKTEFKKFNYEFLLKNVTFSAYASMHKHVGDWDVVILDEAHHTSERCRELLSKYNIKHLVGLSATLNTESWIFFNSTYKPYIIKSTVQEAFDDGILPEPKIYLLPISLNNTISCYTIERKGKNSKKPLLTIPYAKKWQYKKYEGPINYQCTARQYYNDMSDLIDWYKTVSYSNKALKNAWLRKCGERLVWLAEQKTDIINNILKTFKNRRTLTFVPSIKESEKINCPSINSKVGTETLEQFNNKKIKHISAIEMLTEGSNLTDCRICMFQIINSSQRLNIQKIGRALRHKKPIILYVYYTNTREEQILNDMLKDYNSELIKKINSIDEIEF